LERIIAHFLAKSDVCITDNNRNLSLDEIGERYLQIPITAWISHGCETLSSILNFHVPFAYLIGKSLLFSVHRDFFDYCALLVLLLTYLLTNEFLRSCI